MENEKITKTECEAKHNSLKHIVNNLEAKIEMNSKITMKKLDAIDAALRGEFNSKGICEKLRDLYLLVNEINDKEVLERINNIETEIEDLYNQINEVTAQQKKKERSKARILEKIKGDVFSWVIIVVIITIFSLFIHFFTPWDVGIDKIFNLFREAK